MLSLIALILIPALARAADPTASNTSSTPTPSLASNATAGAAGAAAGAAALPSCALTCTVQTAPSSPCPDPANLTCSCTSKDFQEKLVACYKTSCSGSDFSTTLTVGASLCATAGHPVTPIVPSTLQTGAASTAPNATGSTGAATPANVTHAVSSSHNASATEDGKTVSASASRSSPASSPNSGSQSLFHQVSAALATAACGAAVYLFF